MITHFYTEYYHNIGSSEENEVYKNLWAGKYYSDEQYGEMFPPMALAKNNLSAEQIAEIKNRPVGFSAKNGEDATMYYGQAYRGNTKLSLW